MGAERDPYAVLGVEPGATDEQVHDAWRALARRHHPDAHAGSSAKVRAAAERRMRDINAAFHSIRSSRTARPAAAPVSKRALNWRCVYCGHAEEVDLLSGKRWDCGGCGVHVRHLRCPATNEPAEVYWHGTDHVERCARCGYAHRKAVRMPAYGECFVASAVYGSASAPEVAALRAWRDEVLVRSRAGRAVIAAYAVVGPWGARAVRRWPRLRPPARAALDRVSRAAAGAAGRRPSTRGGTPSG